MNENLVVCFFFDFGVDAPRNLQISPTPQSIYHPGDRIQCSAEGNPAPSLEWKELNSGNVSKGATLSITGDMLDKTYTLQCTASNEYNGMTYTETENITFAVRVQGAQYFSSVRSVLYR